MFSSRYQFSELSCRKYTQHDPIVRQDVSLRQVHVALVDIRLSLFHKCQRRNGPPSQIALATMLVDHGARHTIVPHHRESRSAWTFPNLKFGQAEGCITAQGLDLDRD